MHFLLAAVIAATTVTAVPVQAQAGASIGTKSATRGVITGRTCGVRTRAGMCVGPSVTIAAMCATRAATGGVIASNGVVSTIIACPPANALITPTTSTATAVSISSAGLAGMTASIAATMANITAADRTAPRA